jgi:hypothetical protein
MGQSAKLERQCLSKHTNITFPLFISSKSQGTLRSESPGPSFINLHGFTIVSQVICLLDYISHKYKPFLVNLTSRVAPCNS